MMNQASLYQRANNVQRHDAQQVLREYAHVLQWRDDGRDSLIDIGCGSGNVLMDFVYPILPKEFTELVGTDISSKMVGYASKLYANYERTKFKVLDISSEKLPQEMSEQFDHVTSFYCLHLVQDQRQALQNIYKLLRLDGGDCLLVFLAANPIFDVYKILATYSKWADYMKDVDSFISPLHYSNDPSTEICNMLQEAGFADYNVEVRNEKFIYEGLENLKDNVKAVCPFMDRLPEEKHDDFLVDFVQIVINMKLREDDVNLEDYKFISPYKLVVAYARKCGGLVTNIMAKVGEQQKQQEQQQKRKQQQIMKQRT